jgi:hypothetical protein
MAAPRFRERYRRRPRPQGQAAHHVPLLGGRIEAFQAQQQPAEGGHQQQPDWHGEGRQQAGAQAQQADADGPGALFGRGVVRQRGQQAAQGDERQLSGGHVEQGQAAVQDPQDAFEQAVQEVHV